MARTWLRTAAALGLVVGLSANSVSAQSAGREPATNLQASINAEAAKLARDEARFSESAGAARKSSGPSGSAKSKAAFGAAFGLIGLLVGAEVAAHTKSASSRGDMTSGQLLSVLGGGAAGLTIGVWLGGR
jgi:hypothetical protein